MKWKWGSEYKSEYAVLVEKMRIEGKLLTHQPRELISPWCGRKMQSHRSRRVN
jgi:hypothetical protein